MLCPPACHIDNVHGSGSNLDASSMDSTLCATYQGMVVGLVEYSLRTISMHVRAALAHAPRLTAVSKLLQDVMHTALNPRAHTSPHPRGQGHMLRKLCSSREWDGGALKAVAVSFGSPVLTGQCWGWQGCTGAANRRDCWLIHQIGAHGIHSQWRSRSRTPAVKDTRVK
jgi:hypothetical protein